jgi:hypothetical protein
LIKSGNVFIYEEHSSGIKRWTDGVPWSPSRILGNFLVYRELERPFPPGEKKRAMKRSKRSPGISKQESFGASSVGIGSGYNVSSAASSNFDSPNQDSLSKETERSLIGSLVDSYGFKEEGLVKKTVSVTVSGVSHHLVSYYTVADAMNNNFTTPSNDPRFQNITPRPGLITKQNFRTPIDEADSMDRMDDRSVYAADSYARNGYEMTNQSISHRPMSLPTPPLAYNSNSRIYYNYGSSPHSAPHDNLSQDHSNNPYNSQFAPSPSSYPASKTEKYDLGVYRQQRYNAVIGIRSESTRPQTVPVTTNFARCSSNFDQGSSIDSGLSGISSATSDSKLTNDSGYPSQGFFGTLRNTTNIPHSYSIHRSLPTPTQQIGFNRAPTHSCTGLEDSNAKEKVWLMGNASAGHGHHMAAQQQ